METAAVLMALACKDSLHTLVNNGCGFHRDELQTTASGVGVRGVSTDHAVPVMARDATVRAGTAEGKQYRMVGWMYVRTCLELWAAPGRDYYLAPAYPGAVSKRG